MDRQAADRTGDSRRTTWIAALMAWCFVLAGMQAARAADAFTIDVVLPLTGPAAFLGSSLQLATQIAAAKPALVLGSAVVAMCNAMAPLMRRVPPDTAVAGEGTDHPAG